MNTQEITDKRFLDAGFTKAGGVWGDAQWKRLDAITVVSVGGAYKKTSTEADDDFTQAPERLDYPCLVHVYMGRGCVNWDIKSGEQPEVKTTMHVSHPCSSVDEALDLVRKLATIT